MDYYNSIAKGYNRLHKEEQLRKLKIIGQHLPENSLILDVGCGSGLSSILGNVIGIDPSRKLLLQAPFPSVEGVAQALPFKENSFKAVVSVTALHHCTDIGAAILEIKRVATHTILLSILKRAKNYRSMEQEIKNTFTVTDIIEDSTDTIFVCTK